MQRGRKRTGGPPALIGALALGLVAVSACGGGGTKAVERLFSPQDNQLDIYDLATGQRTVLIPSAQNNVNGQACELPNGNHQFLMAEDTNQDEGERQGWMIFSSDGEAVMKLPEPSAPNEPEQIEPYGCVFDDQERLFVSDVGQEDFEGGSGKLVLFFPPDYATPCLLSTTLQVAGMLALDDDGSVLAAESLPPGAVLRFSPPFPEDANDCEKTPANASVFIQDPNIGTPAGIARAPNGHWYVSSVILPPAINEYDQDGRFVRAIASGPDIGNPEGIAVDSLGTIYYGDLGLIQTEDNPLPHPGKDKGTVRKIAFDTDGNPQPPVIMGRGLNFPDAVSVIALP